MTPAGLAVSDSVARTTPAATTTVAATATSTITATTAPAAAATAVAAASTVAAATATVATATSTVAATTTAATVTTAAAATTAAATAAATATFPLACFIHAQLAAFDVMAVQARNRSLRVRVRHFDETETAEAAGLAIVDQPHRVHGTVLRKQHTDRFLIGGIRQVAYVDPGHDGYP